MKKKSVFKKLGSILYIVFFSPFLFSFILSEGSGLLERIEPFKQKVRTKRAKNIDFLS